MQDAIPRTSIKCRTQKRDRRKERFRQKHRNGGSGSGGTATTAAATATAATVAVTAVAAMVAVTAVAAAVAGTVGTGTGAGTQLRITIGLITVCSDTVHRRPRVPTEGKSRSVATDRNSPGQTASPQRERRAPKHDIDRAVTHTNYMYILYTLCRNTT